MSKLTLIKLPNNSWAATYENEEARNIGGRNNEERLFNAAMIWGLDVDEVECEIDDGAEKAYTLRDYIDVFYGGNNSEFARSQAVTRQQVNEWLGKDYIVMCDTLFSPRRVLSSPLDG